MRQVIYGSYDCALGQIVPAVTLVFLVQCTLIHAEPATVFYLPTAADMRVDVAGFNIAAIDFMTVKHCALKATILKNQTRIARHASDSQRLLLDLEYLRLAPACIAQLKSEGVDVLAETLTAALRVIEQHLPARIFNATLGSSQYRPIWRAGVSGNKHTANGAQALTALREINRLANAWLARDYRANNLDFEIQLSEVAKARAHYGEFYAQQINEVLRLEVLLQKALPLAYLRWQQRR